MRIDYCNVIYYGLLGTLANKLQKVQNAAARIIKRKFNMRSIEDVYEELHWLKVKKRIMYKILVIAHKCITGSAPPALCGLFSFSTSQRLSLQMETKGLTKFGERTFSHVAPKLWNLIPLKVKNEHDETKFKKLLKSFLLLDGQSFMERIKIQ